MVAVTGADGFIGQNFISELHSRNILYRTLSLPEFDLTRENSLLGSFDGCDIVYHFAALARQQGNYLEEDYHRVNVLGTKHLLVEAKKSGVKRFVFISSIEAAGSAINCEPLTEETVPHPENAYGRSKLAAEKLVIAENGSGMETVVVRLPMIYGPGNYLNVPKLFKAVRRPIFPLFGNGTVLMEFCYVGNAIHGILLAGTNKNASGEIFFISDGSKRLIDVVKAVAKAQYRNPFILKIPIPIANTIAIIVECLASVFPIRPFVSPITHKPYITRKTVMWTTRTLNICSYKKAENVLLYKPPFTTEQGITQTVNDFRKRGWI